MIDDLKDFLAHAVQLEADAAEGYAILGERMRAQGNDEVAALFAKLGEFSRLHLAETQQRYNDLAGEFVALQPGHFRWPDGSSPENPAAAETPADMDVLGAMQLALSLERGACDFYSAVANQTRSAAVQELAQAFTEEESEHVSHLERWLARMPQG